MAEEEIDEVFRVGIKKLLKMVEFSYFVCWEIGKKFPEIIENKDIKKILEEIEDIEKEADKYR